MLLALLAQAAIGAPAVPPCRPAQLRLGLDGRDGDFDGMSHSGVELSLRNTGPACALPALPAVAFLDAHGRPLPAMRRAPPGMHPGPVMVPVRLARGARAATGLRWVSGPVYDGSRALAAAAVSVWIGGSTLRAPWRATLYAPGDTPASFDQPPLAPAD